MTSGPKTYVINLARRPDRLQRISALLDELEISFSRIEAVDAKSVANRELEVAFAANRKNDRVSKGDLCCTFSHRKCWEAFAASGEQHALVLEDDVEIHADAKALLGDLTWLPDEVELLKIESFGSSSRRILVGEPRRVAGGTWVAPLHSRHLGSAAYILRRTLALWLLAEVRRWPMSIDHMLFNPRISPIASAVRPFQLIPTVARQVDLKGDSDIDEGRPPFRGLGWRSMRRSARRYTNALRVAPRHALDVLTGKSRWIRI
jgi:glycosyl transferase family 25